MYRLAVGLFLCAGLGSQAGSCHDPRMVYRFDDIQSSANLTWTPCFDGLTCSKLEVPLDYSKTSLGTAAIAFMKLPGKNATADSPSIVIIPGGPGGSGIDLLLTYRSIVGQLFGEQYNFVSFDPRGVNNSGPSLDCFSGNTDARSAFMRLHKTGATNASTSSLEEQFQSASIYGEWCNNAVESHSPHGYYVTTPAAARDLLTFIEAEAWLTGRSPSDAKLWAYGISYGTVIGSTFAAMFPDRVERMILDGVLNAEEYYDSDFRQNLDQTDQAMGLFSTYCHAAGPDKCALWESSPAEVAARVDRIIAQLQSQPVPLSGLPSRELPTMVTSSDLEALFLSALSSPVTNFPVMADILQQVEGGNVSALAGSFAGLADTSDARLVIQCTDSPHRNKLNTLEDFRSYVEYAVARSRYIGDIYPIYVDLVLCRSFQPHLSDSMVVQGPIKLDRPPAYPILFASNTVDPVTPLTSARNMSSRFPGSVLLTQQAVGHTVINQGGSDCYFGYIQAYLQGAVPPSNTTCSQQYTPFLDASPF